MDINRKMKVELERMKEKFMLLETDEERLAFKVEMEAFVENKTDKEKEELSHAFLEGAHQACISADKVYNEALRIYLDNIYDTVSWSYIAKKYFNKSRSWLCQRLNGIRVGKKEAQFTEAEKKILISALQDISKNIQDTALVIEHL